MSYGHVPSLGPIPGISRATGFPEFCPGGGAPGTFDERSALGSDGEGCE